MVSDVITTSIQNMLRDVLWIRYISTHTCAVVRCAEAVDVLSEHQLIAI